MNKPKPRKIVIEWTDDDVIEIMSMFAASARCTKKEGNQMKASDLIGLKNALSRQSGAAFEELVNRSCDYYEEQGVAKIEKTPEPMKVLANLGGGMFKAVFTKQAQPDYKGTIRGGVPIVFETKHTDTDRIKRSVITEEQ